MNQRILAFALLVGLATPLLAQGGGRETLTRAIHAYQELDFEGASALLRHLLAGELADSDRVLALTYLGAAEHYRARPDSASAAFGRLVALAPAYQPDTLVFPPEITRLYSEVHSRTPVAVVRAPVDTERPPPPRDTTPVTASPRPRTEMRSGGQVIATAGATVASMRARSEPSGLPPGSGTVLGMTLGASVGRFELSVRYSQGSLGTRDVVEGAAALRFAATPWLAVHAGPQIRRYDSPTGAERWTTWQLGARGDWAIIERVRGHAMVWQGFGLQVNVPPGRGSASGGEVGVTVDPSLGPLWLGLTYAGDRAAVRGSSRRETVATLIFTAGLRHGQ